MHAMFQVDKIEEEIRDQLLLETDRMTLYIARIGDTLQLFQPVILLQLYEVTTDFHPAKAASNITCI